METCQRQNLIVGGSKTGGSDRGMGTLLMDGYGKRLCSDCPIACQELLKYRLANVNICYCSNHDKKCPFRAGNE